MNDVRSIAETASRIVDPSARLRFIEDACDDERTIAEVRRLVDLHDSVTIVEDHARELPPVPTVALASGAAPGRWISAYRLIEVLGRGAMGTVWRAEQMRPRREIALKILRADALDPDALRRFEIEAAALARLQHPNIAAIHAVGAAAPSSAPPAFDPTDDAADADVAETTRPVPSTVTTDVRVPWFAMELVRGRPLDIAARDVDVATRIDLMITIAEAVDHAHRRGIIHRDLKPANILVDDDGRPRVLDFGIARATDPTAGSGTLAIAGETIVGTVPYMSPEQIAGAIDEVDTRSDVYALGVILHEILAGARPFDVSRMTLTQAAMHIGETPPPPLGADDPSLRGDLATIVGKALEKNPARRYQSAAALAEDLQRWREHQPILARRPSVLYNARLFARRHAGAVAGVALALAAILVGSGFSIAKAVEATNARGLADRRATQAETAEALAADRAIEAEAARFEADRNAAAAATAAEQARTEASRARAQARRAETVNSFLQTMFSSADPERGRGREVTVAEVLDDAERSAELSFAELPDLHASILTSLSVTSRGLGLTDEALRLAERATEIGEVHLDDDDPVRLSALRALTNVLTDLGRAEEAEAVALEVAEGLETIDVASPIERALAWSSYALASFSNGRFDDAFAAWEPIIPEISRIPPGWEMECLTALSNYGVALKEAGRYQESHDVLRRVVSERTMRLGEDHPITLLALNGLAGALQRLERHEEALDALHLVLDGRVRRLGDDHPSTNVARSNLAVAYVGLDRHAEAEPLMRRALAVQSARFGDVNARTQTMRSNLAFVLEDLERLDEARAVYEEALRFSQPVEPGRVDLSSWTLRNNYGMLLLRIGDGGAALETFAGIVEEADAALPPGHPYMAIFLDNMGEAASRSGAFDRARAAFARSGPALVAGFGEDHERVAQHRERVAELEAREEAAVRDVSGGGGRD